MMPAMSTTADRWTTLGDTPLAAARYGDDGLRRVVFLHGFTQTMNSWKPVAALVADRGFECIVVDLPGHGDSGTVSATLDATAALLADTTGAAAYVGYSLGGRTALHLALAHPHLVPHLVLIGANPGIEDALERAERLKSDQLLAQRLRSEGLEMFLEQWLEQPLFAGLIVDDAARADRLRNTVEGLVSSLELAGTGAQASLWPQLPSLSMPVLAMAGAHDAKFTALAHRIAAAVRHGAYLEVPDASHACHLQQPALVADSIVEFLDRSPVRH